jgi:hypothetical protein
LGSKENHGLLLRPGTTRFSGFFYSLVSRKGTMKTAIVTLCLILVANTSSAETLDAVSRTAAFLYKDSVETIVIEGVPHEIGLRPVGKEAFIPKTMRSYGTGFFILNNDRLYLATAKHVARFMDKNSYVLLQAEGPKPLKVSLLELSGSSGDIAWRSHRQYDVAVVRLIPPETIRPSLKGHFLPSSYIEVQSPSRDVLLTVIGFPLTFGSDTLFSPISRDTNIAGGPVGSKNGPVLLLQDPSVGGFSGGPVFDMRRPRLRAGGIDVIQADPALVGIVSGTFSDDTGGKLGAIVPVEALLELLKEDG